MHLIFDFGPRPGRIQFKWTIAKEQLRAYCPNIYIVIPEHRIFHAEIVLKVMLETEYIAKLNVRAAIQHLKFVWAQKYVKVSTFQDF